MINFSYSFSLSIILFFVFFFPGKIISTLFLGKLKTFANSIAILFGYCYVVIICILFYEYEWELSYLNLIISLSVALSILIMAINGELRTEANEVWQNFCNHKIVFFIFLLAFYVQSNILNISFDNPGSDFWYYGAQTNFFSEIGKLSMKYPYFEATNSIHPYSSIFAIVALLDFNLDWSTMIIINHMGSIFVIAVSYLNYRIISYLIDDDVIAVFSVFVIFVPAYFLNEGELFEFLTLTFYPKNFSVYLFFPFLMFLFLNIKEYGKKILLIIPFLTLSFINLHPQNLLWVVIFFFAYSLLDILEKKSLTKDLVYLNISVAMILSIYSLMIVGLLYSESSSFSQYTDNSNDVELIKFLGTRIVDPLLFIETNNIFYIGWNSFTLICLMVLFAMKRNYLILYSVCLFFFISFILFNPFTVSMLLKIMPSFIFDRFIHLLPLAIIQSYLVAIIIKKLIFYFGYDSYIKSQINILQLNHLRNYFYAFIVSLLIIVFTGKFIPSNKISDELYDFFDFIDTNFDVDSFVLTDETTAYKIPAYKKIRVLTINENFLFGHMNIEQVNDVKMIFDESIDISSKINILNKYNFDHIVFNKNLNKNILFESSINGYSVVFDNALYKIYKLNH